MKPQINLTVGQRLWQIAERQRLKKVEISKALDVSRQTFDNWINGKGAPDATQLEIASRILNVSLTDLLGVTVPASDEPAPGGQKKIPLYDTIAVGGIGLLADQSRTANEPEDYVYAGSMFTDAVASVKVYGDSMWPKYPNGSIVVCREVKDRELILWGQVYVIETSEYRVIKRVQKGEAKNSIRADSENAVKNGLGKEIHESMEIDLSKIKRLFLVVGMANRLQA